MARPRTLRISRHDPDAADSSGDECGGGCAYSSRRVRFVVREIPCSATSSGGGERNKRQRRARGGGGRKKAVASATWLLSAAEEEKIKPNRVFAGYEFSDVFNEFTLPDSVIRKASSLSTPEEAKGGNDTGGLIYNEFSDFRVSESAILEDAFYSLSTRFQFQPYFDYEFNLPLGYSVYILNY